VANADDKCEVSNDVKPATQLADICVHITRRVDTSFTTAMISGLGFGLADCLPMENTTLVGKAAVSKVRAKAAFLAGVDDDRTLPP
jgi:hypothetical protein